MSKRPAWSAAEAEIIDDRYIRRQQRPEETDELIEKIAWLMDRSVPIGGFRVGLDPIIGLIPGIGDVLSGMISALLIVQAHRAGVPRATVLRMLANVGIDSALGSIPFVGDLFDFAWKANSKNLELYRRAVTGQRRPVQDWGFLVLILLVLALLVTVPILLAIWAIRSFS